jgi:predicted nucleotidyltransferase
MRTVAKAPIDWLIPQVRKKVLALLLTAPDQRWHLRDIARRTGCALGTVQRELAGLTAAQIVVCNKDGNRTYYRPNQSSPLFPDLSGLIRKTAGLADVVRSALSSLTDKIAFALIYGSQAKGTASAASDIDLLVVGDLDEMALHRAVGEAEKHLNRPVNYTLLGRSEFRRKSKDKGGFLGRVLAGPKMVLVGATDDV